MCTSSSPCRRPGRTTKNGSPPGPLAGGGGPGESACVTGSDGKRVSLGAPAPGGSRKARHCPAHRPGAGAALFPCCFSTQREEKCLSSRTIMNCHLVISIVLGQAEKEMRIPLNPAHRASPPQAGGPRPQLFPNGRGGKDPAGFGGRAHQVAGGGAPAAGLRLPAGETLGLKWDHVDWEKWADPH